VQHRNIKSRVIRTSDGGRPEMPEGTGGLKTKTNHSNGTVVYRLAQDTPESSLHLCPNVTRKRQY